MLLRQTTVFQHPSRVIVARRLTPSRPMPIGLAVVACTVKSVPETAEGTVL